MSKVRVGIASWFVLLACPSAPASDVVEPQPAIEEILVTGQQPGPGLWKVTRPADGADHVLWILGSYGPLPRKMSWRSAELETALAESQAVIAPVSMRASVGALGGVTLLPSLVGLRRNPDDARLQDVVPPELYARWLPLKERYIGRDEDVEKWRPIFAAQELWEQALRKSGLEPFGVVADHGEQGYRQPQPSQVAGHVAGHTPGSAHDAGRVRGGVPRVALQPRLDGDAVEVSRPAAIEVEVADPAVALNAREIVEPASDGAGIGAEEGLPDRVSGGGRFGDQGGTCERDGDAEGKDDRPAVGHGAPHNSGIGRPPAS